MDSTEKYRRIGFLKSKKKKTDVPQAHKIASSDQSRTKTFLLFETN